MDQPLEKIGQYRIIREIGRGATSVVYLAEDLRSAEQVAVKYVRFGDASKDKALWNRRLLKLLRAEALVSERLKHPNIIQIFFTEITDEYAYVVMEYFPGGSLERYCRFDNLLPVHRVIGIVFKCCMALDYAYRQGIVHRDIKPANILVDDQDNVKITDFGLALNVNKKVESDTTFIMGVGSPAYMSPEQVKGYPLNQKTDLYSLGVVLFHLLAGRLPFRASNPGQLVYKILNADPPSVSLLSPEVPEQMNALIRKALEKDLYSRYKNGADFAKDLAAVRYKILDENYAPPDISQFSALRRLSFFTEFDDVEVWEVLRISMVRSVDKQAVLVNEGDVDQRFGIVLKGEVELSIHGRLIMRLKEGEVFGVQAWLDHREHHHKFTVISSTPLTYLEVNPAALALASDEVLKRFHQQISTEIIRRFVTVAERFATYCEPSLQGTHTASGKLELKLKLMEDT